MVERAVVDVIIPAYNEGESIQLVIKDIPKDLVREIVVVNNNSSDNTAEKARLAGARVLDEPKMGYGRACLKGISHLSQKQKVPDIVVFMDGDYSDHAEDMRKLVEPIVEGKEDITIGVRTSRKREDGSMTPQQVFGNKIAAWLIRLLYQKKITDLGPFRAIRYDSLIHIGMKDKTYGWTVEMQLKSIKNKLRMREVEVSYRKRIGVSKVSGTLKGTILAGYKIITTILKYR